MKRDITKIPLKPIGSLGNIAKMYILKHWKHKKENHKIYIMIFIRPKEFNLQLKDK